MSPAKRFLLILFGVYLAGGVTTIFMFRPPGMSKAYLAKYKAEHDWYIKVIKSDAYKLYVERPHLHTPDERLGADIAFVGEYEARPVFQAEKRRRLIFASLFEVLNVGAVLALVYHFARKPFLNFVDGQIAALRTKLERARQARAAAAERRAEARSKVEGLDDDTARIAREGDDLRERELARIEAATRQGLDQIDRVTDDRKRGEQQKAVLQVKRELVTQSIELLAQRYRAQASAESEAALVDQFIRGLKELK